MHKLLVPALFLGCAVIQDAPAGLKASIEKTRAQKSYTASFTGKILKPGSDPFEIKGDLVWVTPGVLFISYSQSGGDEIRAVRVGDEAWMYHDQSDDFVTTEEAGKPGIGRGLQNPDDVLSALLKVVDRVKAGGKEKVGDQDCERYDAELKGEQLADVMKTMASRDNFDFAKSTGSIRAWTAGDGRLRQLDFGGELFLKAEGEKGTFKGGVEVKAYDRDYALVFKIKDPAIKKERVIPLAEVVAGKIAALKGVPPELLGQLAKLQGH